MKKLYVVRPSLMSSGLAIYKQIEGDTYKDTSCSDHKNCIVKITQNNKGSYDIVEMINDEAKKYDYFHHYTTPLFETKAEAIISYADYKIKEHKNDIDKQKTKMTEFEVKLKELEQNELIINTPKITDFDFDDTVYLARIDKSDSDILNFKVAKKIFDKNGLLEIQSDDYGSYWDEYGDNYINGYYVNTAMIFKDDNDNRFNAFKDKESAENSLRKLKIELLKKEIELCEKYIKDYEKYIEKCNKAKKDAKNETA